MKHGTKQSSEKQRSKTRKGKSLSGTRKVTPKTLENRKPDPDARTRTRNRVSIEYDDGKIEEFDMPSEEDMETYRSGVLKAVDELMAVPRKLPELPEE